MRILDRIREFGINGADDQKFVLTVGDALRLLKEIYELPGEPGVTWDGLELMLRRVSQDNADTCLVLRILANEISRSG